MKAGPLPKGAPQDLTARLLDPTTRAALVIAHPAHEMRVFEWMSRLRPLTFVLTTGSRSGDDRTRLEATRAIIGETGATTSKSWAGIEDRLLYSWIMGGRTAGLIEHTLLLADELLDSGIEIVVADTWQLYNVAHDLTHVMAHAAARLAAQRSGVHIPIIGYPVVPLPMAPDVPLGERLVNLELPDDRYALKRATAARIPLVAQEVMDIERADGPQALRSEMFHEPLVFERARLRPVTKPYYEVYGEARVTAGLYKHVIRWPHVERCVAALLAFCGA